MPIKLILILTQKKKIVKSKFKFKGTSKIYFFFYKIKTNNKQIKGLFEQTIELKENYNRMDWDDCSDQVCRH